MGSGPGPERIGSGRHRLCGARVLLQPRPDVQGMFALPQFFVCLDRTSLFSCVPATKLPLQATIFTR